MIINHDLVEPTDTIYTNLFHIFISNYLHMYSIYYNANFPTSRACKERNSLIHGITWKGGRALLLMAINMERYLFSFILFLSMAKLLASFASLTIIAEGTLNMALSTLSLATLPTAPSAGNRSPCRNSCTLYKLFHIASTLVTRIYKWLTLATT